MDALSEIAARHKLQLLFDAAHAFSSSRHGKMIGGFGAAEVFSFHATKFVSTGEGGAVTTNDDDLAQRMRLMRNFGFGGLDNVIYIGTNGKMNEISAAMGLASLDSLEDFITVNRRNYHLYRQELASIPGLSLIDYDETERCNYQYIVLEVDPYLTRLSRDELIEVLVSENVLARRYFYPGCHRMEPYRSYFPHANLVLRATDVVAQRVLLLPTGTSIGQAEIREICQVLRIAIAGANDVQRALATRTEQRLPSVPEKKVA